MEENELIVDDVPETSNEEQIETNASEGVEEVQSIQSSQDDIERQIEERANAIAQEKMEARLIRDRIKREREEAPLRAKYEQLENMMKTALGATDLDDVISKSKDFYTQQGISIPEVVDKPFLSERKKTLLAKDDAELIISLGKKEMEYEANRIAAIPEKERSFEDKTIFNELCKELVKMKEEDSLKEKGYNLEILKDNDFNNFRKQFNVSTPLTNVYEMYQKLNGTKPTQPPTPGSLKTNTTNNEIKDYYTPEEVRKFTEEELDNPKLWQAIELSMQKWSKNK